MNSKNLTRDEMIDILGEYHADEILELDNFDGLYSILTGGFIGYESYKDDELRQYIEEINSKQYKISKKYRDELNLKMEQSLNHTNKAN